MCEYAADLLVRKQFSGPKVAGQLVAKGLDAADAHATVANLETQLKAARRKAAKKDCPTAPGALWYVGGPALTLANIDFIF